MNVVQEAARIAAARFAALATSVYGYDPITGALTWKNNKLPAGTNYIAGYGFGTYDPATGSFALVGFTVDGVQYIWGSALLSPAPAQGSSKTESIPSYAVNISEAATFDVYCFIAASGTLGLYQADFGQGSRVIGWKWADFQKLGFVAAKVFEDVLTVNPYVGSAEITAFSVARG